MRLGFFCSNNTKEKDMPPHVPKSPPNQLPQCLQRFSGLLYFILAQCCQKNISHPPEKTKIPLSQNVRSVSMAENTEKAKPQPKTISELVFIGISEKGFLVFCVGVFK